MCPREGEAVAALTAGIGGSFPGTGRIFVEYFLSRNMVSRLLYVLDDCHCDFKFPHCLGAPHA